MHISSFFGLRKGHAALDFIDIDANGDTLLFLDPCLIERGTDPLSAEAALIIADFEDSLFDEMRNGNWYDTSILNYAHEVHDTKLGFGTGCNGKGKTASGIRESFSQLYHLANGIPTISEIQDLSVFVEDFAEDCLSDLLTNILHRLLHEFTATQMCYLGKAPDGYRPIQYWDRHTHEWRISEEPFWVINGERVLLVPKYWVRRHFLFKAHQYLCGVIIERIRRADLGYDRMSKMDIHRNMERTSEHWEYDAVIDHTYQDPDAFEEYHDYMRRAYNKPSNFVSDEQLDRIVYGYSAHASA